MRRLEREEEERKSAESAEVVDNQENKSEDENRNIEVLTTSPEEICEQLQNLIVQLSRCDSGDQQSDKSDKGSSEDQPVLKLTKCDTVLPQDAGGKFIKLLIW